MIFIRIISNSFKISRLNLKLLGSKRPFLLFAEILSAKCFPQFILKFEIFISNGSFCNFYSNLPKTYFVLKMSKKKSSNSKWAPFKYSTWKFSSQINHTVFFTQLCAKLSLYSKWPNETKKPFKCPKWKFSSQIDSGVFV